MSFPESDLNGFAGQNDPPEPAIVATETLKFTHETGMSYAYTRGKSRLFIAKKMFVGAIIPAQIVITYRLDGK